jgi:hypothetical protein
LTLCKRLPSTENQPKLKQLLDFASARTLLSAWCCHGRALHPAANLFSL